MNNKERRTSKRLFSSQSNFKPGAGKLIRQDIRIFLSRFSSLSMILALIFPFLWVQASSAQSNAGFIRLVRTMESDQTGLLRPAGLAFSSKANAFQVIEGQSTSANTDVINLTPFEDRVGSARIAAAIKDPINVAYDNRLGRLLILHSAASQLLEVREDAEGNLDASTLTRHAAGDFGLQDPQGMVVDASSGALYILDAAGPRIVQVEPGADGSFEGAAVSVIDLGSSDIASPRGLALDPRTGNLHLVLLAEQKLVELTQSGDVVASRDLARLGLQDPQGMVFASSTDQTDDPSQINLFLADSGQSEHTVSESQSTGQVLELSLDQPVAAAAAAFTSSLVRTTDLSAVSPPSPDPSGITYLPNSNTLLMSDSEVEETVNGITHFQGANVWELTLSGNVVRTTNISTVPPTAVPMTNEPSGVTLNPINGHYFFTDDSAKEVYDLNPGGDELVGTDDDSWNSFDTLAVGNGDPEGITYDAQNNRLFVADGVNMEVYQYTTAGVLVSQFDVELYGVLDPESVEFNPDSSTLFIMSSSPNSQLIIETTTDGALLQTINISAANPKAAAGLAYAPASDGSGVQRFYIVDRGIDNDSDPNLIDGKMYEMTTPSGTPTPPPSTTTLFVSATGSGSLGGVAFRDEDIMKFDGSSWSLLFDGSDVGLGAVDVFAFHLVDADTLLLAFNTSVTVGGQTFAPTDIAQFDATSLGLTTAGTFSMYFNGVDVGLDASNDYLDALEILPDGSLLVSTRGNPSVPGVTGALDEDILAFAPTTLGDTTSGTWAMYFDGSDVGLADTSNEDIDALDVDPNGAIYPSAAIAKVVFDKHHLSAVLQLPKSSLTKPNFTNNN